MYVVSIAPSGNEGGVGGFFWYPATERVAAIAGYVREVRDSARQGGSHVVRLVTVAMPDDLTPEEVTDILEEELEVIESITPAIRQYVPACTTLESMPRAKRVLH